MYVHYTPDPLLGKVGHRLVGLRTIHPGRLSTIPAGWLGGGRGGYRVHPKAVSALIRDSLRDF
jgi:hypothetical protein